MPRKKKEVNGNEENVEENSEKEEMSSKPKRTTRGSGRTSGKWKKMGKSIQFVHCLHFLLNMVII